MRELNFLAAGKLGWVERDEPVLQGDDDAIVRPFVAARCDGDVVPIHNRVSRPLQLGIKVGLIDPAVGHIAGPVPYRAPFAIGHECVAEVVQVGSRVSGVEVGDKVVVPWSVSCGRCAPCERGLTSKCATTTTGSGLAAFGLGAPAGGYGGMVSDLVRVPFASHMLVRLPPGLDPLRVAAASDNLPDGWRAVVPHLRARPDATVLVVGGGARSIGLYAAGLAVVLGAPVVHYVDHSSRRLKVAEAFGAEVYERSKKATTPRQNYDIVVEASSRTAGVRYAVRATATGGVCTVVGYYFAARTGVPLMHMYANDITLRVGVAHPRAILPEVLQFVHERDFPAETVTSHLTPWDEAPEAYAERTTKLVLHRPPLT